MELELSVHDATLSVAHPRVGSLVDNSKLLFFFLKNLEREKECRDAMAGNRTRVNCLEGSYAHHYTTIATLHLKD